MVRGTPRASFGGDLRSRVIMYNLKRSSVSFLVALVMIVASFAVLSSASASADPAVDYAGSSATPEGTGPNGALKSHSPPADDKIDAALKERMKDSHGKIKVDLIVTDRAMVNLQLGEMGIPEIRGFEFKDRPTPRTIELDAKQIWLLAANHGISRIMSHPEPTFEPGVDKAALEAEGIEMAPDPIFDDYFVNEVHGAVSAWDKGYTGSGVNIAVIDTGFDMAHPDLQGQQARYTSGPYDGWPISYDDMAAYDWASGTIGGWVSDTREDVEDLGGFVEFDGSYYVVDDLKDVYGNPVVSQSGWFRMGYHPDPNLASLWGSPIAVLVVDSITPFVYDTVYVDVTCDYDFNNDKACTKGDEISYFDVYDADTDTYDYSNWDAGDGFADLSGGMVYWISDGTNILPGSDLYWGASWVPDSGDAVAFMGEFFYGESHGTMTSSAALATGSTLGGLLGGMAPGASLITIPLTYGMFGPWLFAVLGADGTPYSGDEAHIVSNSYGFSDTAIWAGYDYYDAVAWAIASISDSTLWCWSTGNGGPGYGTAHSITDHSSIHVGAGTTMQYRGLLGYEPYGNQKWGDVIPFSNSGPGRNGKLNAEIIASGAYSLEPAPLNQLDLFGGIADGSMHLQIGSGTSHATPTVAGGAALGYEAYVAMSGGLPWNQEAKTWLMASADDMHYDVFKQGAGWLNASRFVELMGNYAEGTGTVDWSGPMYWRAAAYPGTVYGDNYETFPNLMHPGDSYVISDLVTINFDPIDPVDVNITCKIPLLTASETMNLVTESESDIFADITSLVPATTDLVKVTMFMPLSEFDPDMDYSSDLVYWLEMHDWADLDADGVMNTTDINWELFRYTVDGSDCNYNQVMVKDPIERTTDGLIVRMRAIEGAVGVNMSLRLDCYELQPFPWVSFMHWTTPDWSTGLDFTISPWGGEDYQVLVDVPADAPVGSYGAGIYIDDGDRAQCLPIVVNVAADSYEFEFGGPSAFDTPYNNSFTGIADKGWRFEVGDWRIYWSMPEDSIPSESSLLITSVEWSDLPTDVNVHVLGSWDWGDPSYEMPYGPGYGMEYLAGSDERYMGAGTFGVGTNTGGPKEVVSSEFGLIYKDWGWAPEPSPFAIVTRCPVMAGMSAYETVTGETEWLDLNGYAPDFVDLYAPIPGAVELEDEIPGWYDITVSEDVEVKGSGIGPLAYEDHPWQPVYQDTLTGFFDYDVANAGYGYFLELTDCDMLTVATYEITDAPDIDMGIWYDANENGVADLSEPYWISGTGGSSEYLALEDLADGQYIIKVLGYTVTGSPGWFGLELFIDVPGDHHVMATDLESPAGSGTHQFNISYSVPAVHGNYYGEASFGFMGADDLIQIPFWIYVEDNAPPGIENIYPADGDVLGTSTVEVSFDVNDSVECYSGFDPLSAYAVLDDWLPLSMTMSVDGDRVTALIPWALPEGEHTLYVEAADIRSNWASEYVTFEVNSVVETFEAEFAHPSTSMTIAPGSTVALDEVIIRGWADPFSDIAISDPHTSYSLAADDTGYFEQEEVALQEGYNVFEVRATNEGEVVRTASLMLISDLTCLLWVAEPPSLTAQADLVLQGLTDVGASVTVDGEAAIVGPDGGWTAEVTLSEGANALLVEAEDTLGNLASQTVSVTLDTTPPSLVITSPEDGTTVSEPSVTITGTTEAGAAVYVNGVLASDGTSSWSATVVLAEGDNTVTVTAEDALGNSATETLSVTYEPPEYVVPDDLDDAVQGLNDTINDLNALLDDLNDLIDDLNDQIGDMEDSQEDLQAQADDADSFARTMMYLVIILFIVSVVLTLVLWNSARTRAKGDGSSPPKDQAHEEPPPPPSGTG